MHREGRAVASVLALAAAMAVLAGASGSTKASSSGNEIGQQSRPAKPAAGVSAAAPTATAFTRATYLAYARASADYAWDHREDNIARWRQTFNPSSVFGYRPPGGLLEIANIYAALVELEHSPVHAQRAKDILLGYGDYRSQYPEAASKARADYGNGVPALPDFFTVRHYLRAYDTLHRLNLLTADEAARLEATAAHSLDYLLQTAEWGAMNRAILRAEVLAWAIRAMPHHPRVPLWEQQRRVLGDDNWGQWEIEDATHYHGIWLYALIGYADARGKTPELFRTPVVYYYAHYFLNLMSPEGTVPDFGDSTWTSNWAHFLVFFETAAAQLRDPQMKWAAQRIAARFLDVKNPTSVGMGSFLLDAYRWSRDDVRAAEPTALSEEVMEDVQGKKIVFRSGWKPESSYLLLNYRDEGDGGLTYRDHLRDSLPVEEEKMTHGHADENSVALLMSGGSVLLHDGGYRDYMPSGPFGAYRQDYFHNRLCVRPEKIWMGQKAGENRYDTPGAVPAQPVLEFLRNAGSYRPIRTRKVDFVTQPEFDYSRTRVIDDGWGYDADRVVVYLKDPELFVVFDIVKARTDEFFTLANLWHTRQVFSRGDRWYDTGYDAIGATKTSDARRLLMVFPQSHFRIDGVEPIKRQGQDEQTVFQAVGRHFELADTEGMVTVLVPHAANASPEDIVKRITLVETTPERAGLAVQIEAGTRHITIGVKQNLRQDIAREYTRPRNLYEKGKIAYGAVESDGDIIVATHDGAQVTYTGVNMTRVQWGQQILFQNGVSFHGNPFDGVASPGGVDKVRYWRDTVKIDGTKK